MQFELGIERAILSLVAISRYSFVTSEMSEIRNLTMPMIFDARAHDLIHLLDDPWLDSRFLSFILFLARLFRLMFQISDAAI